MEVEAQRDETAAAASSIVHVCLGILARNEADHIGPLLQDLGEQTLLTSPNLVVSIFVVANACTDATAQIARDQLSAPAFAASGARIAVHELATAGKANAWNEFVHRIAPQDTDFIFFLDGDIRIPDKGALELILRSLIDAPSAIVAVDRSVKDLELEAPKTLSERLIKAATGTANDTSQAIAGALYCVRYSELKDIWLPIGLPGEDGFLRAMLLTSSFSQPERIERHLFVPGAYHVFESLRDVGGVIRHNVRLTIGTAINILLFWHLREILAKGGNLSQYIRERNASDPHWTNELIKQRLQTSYFPLHKKFLLRRLQQRRSWQSVKAFVLALFGTAFDTVVYIKATRLMRKGAGAGYW